MGNIQCVTCFDRLGHPSGPLIRARRRGTGGIEPEMSDLVAAEDDSFAVNDHYIDSSIPEQKTSNRGSRRRPSVNASALRRQQAKTEEQDYSEEEDEEEDEEVDEEEDEEEDEVSIKEESN